MRNPPYKNIIYIFCGRILDNLVTLLLFAVFARLRPEYLGIYYFGRSTAMLVSTFSELGLSRFIVHTLARYTDHYRTVFGNLFLIRIILSGFAFLLLTAILHLIGLDSLMTQATLVITGSVLLFSISDLLLDTLRAKEEMLLPVLLVTLQRILFVSIGLYGLWLGKGLQWILNIALLTNLLHLIICTATVVHKNGFPKFSINLKQINSIVSEAKPYMLLTTLSTLYSRIGIFLLYYFSDIETIAHYGAAVNIVETLWIMAATVSTAVFPNLVRLHHSSNNYLITGATATVKLLIMIILPIAIGTSILADKIIIFIYGDEFVPSVILLHISIWSTVAIFINCFFNILLQAIGKQWMAALLSVPLVIFHIVLGILLIPKLEGIGAVLATFVSEWGLLIVYMIIINRLFKVSSLFSNIPRLIMPILVMTIVVIFLRQYHVIFAVIFASIIYLSAVVKFHPLTIRELQWFRTVLGKTVVTPTSHEERM